MSNYNETAHDQKRAENIRRQYIGRDETKMEQLQKLDEKVKLPGKVVACILGIIGSIVMGAGMSVVMVWMDMTLGIALSIPGMLVALIAYPVYTLITNNRKKKYTNEILRLSDDIINEKEKS